MARKQQLAYTPSVDVVWDGSVVPCFRIKAEGVLKAKLSDEAWSELQRTVLGYSFGLNHEYAAAPLSEQRKAADTVIDAIINLQQTIEKADTIPLGLIVSYRIADTWDGIWDKGAEYERGRLRMVDDIVATFGADDPEAVDKAWTLMQGWAGTPPMVQPSQPSDLVADLHVFLDAAKTFRRNLDTGVGGAAKENGAWTELVGRLAEWGLRHGVSLWASKSEIYGDSGPFTYLVKAINEQVPILLDDDGKRTEKQMRRPEIADASLADAILKAKARYEANRPDRGQLATTETAE